jgi:hypothetical protein
MKSSRVLFFFCASASLLLLTGCGLFWKKTESSPLAGTWTNAIGTTWTLKDDRTFQVDIDLDKMRDVWGKYYITNDTITFQSTNGLQPKSCMGKGVYHFRREGDTVHFTLVSDTCRLRRKNLELPWRLKQ